MAKAHVSKVLGDDVEMPLALGRLGEKGYIYQGRPKPFLPGK